MNVMCMDICWRLPILSNVDVGILPPNNKFNCYLSFTENIKAMKVYYITTQAEHAIDSIAIRADNLH